MIYQDFNGLSISRLGLGALRFPTLPGEPDHIDTVQARRIVDEAIAQGINYFDTAYTYQKGDSERALGEALSHHPRDSFFLATKFYAAATFSQARSFTQEERQALSQAAEVFLKDLGVPCSGCRYCCDTCPAHLNIPLLIQAYNEHRISGSTWKIQGLTPTDRAGRCLHCGACLKHCPQKIQIPTIMEEAAKAGL